MSDYRECTACRVTFAVARADQRQTCDDCTPAAPPEAIEAEPSMASTRLNLSHLTRALRAAELAVKAELRLQYPEGAQIHALLQSNHTTPSPCTVIGHIGGEHGRLRVKLDGGHVTNVSYTQVRA